jgi:positive regulator of sigma E activity
MGRNTMTLETARTLWKAAALAAFIAILVLLGTRDSVSTVLAFLGVFLGFGVYEVYSRKPGQ